jgi:L-lactate dehydrogenase
MPHKIAVIGAGSVGAAISYALLLRSQVAELHLVDVDTARCQAEVADLSDGTFISNARILCSTLHQAAKCDIIIITAGAKQRDGETRLQLVERNFNILRSIIDGMKSAPAGGIRSDAVLMLVANPVDILTYFAWKLSGLPWGQVFGTGTMLDSMRLRLEIAQRAKVLPICTNLPTYIHAM